MKQAIIGTVGLGGKSVFLPVDHFHAPGETLRAEGIFIEPGGKAYNQAVAARRLGAEVLFFGAMGQDSGMIYCSNFLKSEGITPIPEILPQYNTAYACILTDKIGENRVTVSQGAAAQLSASFIFSQEQHIQRCTHMLLGLECPLEATQAALSLCRKHGAIRF